MIGKLTKKQRSCLADAAVQPLMVIEAGDGGYPIKARTTETTYGRQTLGTLLSRNWLTLKKDDLLHATQDGIMQLSPTDAHVVVAIRCLQAALKRAR